MEQLQAISVGTFRSRFSACMNVLGLQEILLRASIGIDPSLLQATASVLPLVPLINIDGWYQPFVREIICVPPLDPQSAFLHEQQFRDRLLDPVSAVAVRAVCGHKAVIDITWRTDNLPQVCVSGRAFEVTPSSDFTSGGIPFTLGVGDPESLAACDDPPWDFELAVRLARHHWRKRLPEECHNRLLLHAALFSDDPYLLPYLRHFPSSGSS